MHQIDYSQHCTKVRGSAVREAPSSVIFMHCRSVKSCAPRGKTKPTYFKAVTSPWFV
jgi:hypothetical protein